MPELPQSWQVTQPTLYNFINNNSNKLIVTVGDSWTYGAELDSQLRLKQVYGRLVSDQLSADWLNLALSSFGNFWMADIIEELANVIPKLKYDKIYIICVFTGVGRWFNTQFDQHIDYVTWFKNNIQKTEDFDKLLVMLNTNCVSRIKKSLLNFNHVELKIGTNFVDAIGFDDLNTDEILPTPWYQVLGYNDDKKVYTCISYIRIDEAIHFVDKKYHSTFKQWLIEIVNKSSGRIELFNDSKKFKNGHPLVDGHRQWADYILGTL